MTVYSISHIDVVDHESYKKYAEQAPATVAAYGGRYLARNGTKHEVEGPEPTMRVVLMEFPSLAQANAWYTSAEYQALVKIRQAASKSSSIFFIEGGPLP